MAGISIRLGTQQSSWSKPFSMEALDTNGALRVGAYEIGMSIRRAPAAPSFSKLVTFSPRYVLRNELRCRLHVRQAGHSIA